MKWLKNRAGQGFVFHVIILHIILFSENFISLVKESSHFSMLE